ncbi:MAG: hypothetical protein K2X27_17980 [Candidatus Obscuribacterales bacterium]|nr:hypothetical protein [Candidatus Obscuribacterales bacterium]
MATAEPLESAKERFAQGDFPECLRLLTFAFIKDHDNRDCYVLAAMCLRQMKADAEAELFERALANFENYAGFFDLGYHFIDVGHERLAIPMLERAFKLSPGNTEVALELAIAKCGRFQPFEARKVLLECEFSEGFWLRYQFHWSSLLCGITDGAEQFIKDSRRRFLAEAASHEIRGALYALDKLDELRLRLTLLPDPKPLIMHWHFLQYGAAILEYFDDREGQEGLQVAGGRWVYVGLSYKQMASTLIKLKQYLKAIERSPSLILSMPDRDSTIIAHAAARLFGLPLTVIPDPANVGWEESLLIAANNWNLENAAIEKVLKGQSVFAFNLNWLQQGPITPDIAGLMSQYCSFPWSKDRLQIDPESNERIVLPEDLRDPEEIAAEFNVESTEPDEYFPEILDFYNQNALYLKGGRLGGTKRWRFITDSPVPGNYFC